MVYTELDQSTSKHAGDLPRPSSVAADGTRGIWAEGVALDLRQEGVRALVGRVGIDQNPGFIACNYATLLGVRITIKPLVVYGPAVAEKVWSTDKGG